MAGVRRNHGVPGFAAECLGEPRRVLHRADHAKPAGRVRIGQRQFTGALRGHVFAPQLRKADEKALPRREAVHHLADLAVRLLAHGHVCQLEAAVVRRIFAQRQFAVEVNLALVVFYRNEAGVLIGNAIRPPFELRSVVRVPTSW